MFIKVVLLGCSIALSQVSEANPAHPHSIVPYMLASLIGLNGITIPAEAYQHDGEELISPGRSSVAPKSAPRHRQVIRENASTLRSSRMTLSKVLGRLRDGNIGIKLRENEKRSAQLAIWGAIFKAVSYSAAWADNDRKIIFPNRSGAESQFQYESSSTSYGASMSLSLVPEVIGKSLNAEISQKKLDATEYEEALNLTRAYFEYTIAAINLEIYLRTIPYLKKMEQAALKVSNTERRIAVTEQVRSYANLIKLERKRTEANLQVAAVKFFRSIGETPGQILAERENSEEVARRSGFLSGLDWSSPETVKAGLLEVQQAIESSLEIPETSDQAFALASLYNPSLQRARLAKDKSKANRWQSLLEPIKFHVSITDATRPSVIVESSNSLVYGIGFRISGDYFTDLAQAEVYVDSSRLEYEQAEREVYSSLGEIYPEIHYSNESIRISIENYAESYASLLEILRNLDQESPNPETIVSLIDIHRSTLQSLININLSTSIKIGRYLQVQSTIVPDFETLLSKFRKFDKKVRWF